MCHSVSFSVTWGCAGRPEDVFFLEKLLSVQDKCHRNNTWLCLGPAGVRLPDEHRSQLTGQVMTMQGRCAASIYFGAASYHVMIPDDPGPDTVTTGS